MHDYKMMYMLLQHVSYTRKNYPFLLCKCKKNGVIDNETHECLVISDEDQLLLYDRSLNNWNKLLVDNPKYSKSNHMQWCDEYNFGVTHFGVHPKKLPLSIIRSDVFHCRKAVTCSLLEFLCK